MSRDGRLLAEIVAGSDGGWSLWLAALASLDSFVDESREHGRQRFAEYARGELRRLLLVLEEVVRRGEFAVQVRETIAEGVGRDELTEVDALEALLLQRVRQVGDDKGLPRSNFHLSRDYPR